MTIPIASTRVPDRIAKVSAADVQRVATQYLIKTNRSVVLTMPKAPAAASWLAGKSLHRASFFWVYRLLQGSTGFFGVLLVLLGSAEF